VIAHSASLWRRTKVIRDPRFNRKHFAHAEGLSGPPSSEGLEAHLVRDCFPTFPKDSFHLDRWAAAAPRPPAATCLTITVFKNVAP
jgi:hypothetical protein